jgi:hypothetical protein
MCINLSYAERGLYIINVYIHIYLLKYKKRIVYDDWWFSQYRKNRRAQSSEFKGKSFPIATEEVDFSLVWSVMVGSGAKPNSISMGFGAVSYVVKFPVCEAVLLFEALNLRMSRPVLSTLTCALHAVHKDKCQFTLLCGGYALAKRH